MTRTFTALLGGVAALATLDAAQAAIPAAPNPADAMTVHSYAELLTPVPNASELLRADDIAHAQQPRARLQLAEHHHHRHHHHHHHHRRHFRGIWRGFVAPYVYGREHCYWTRGRRYWNGWRWVRRRVRVCD